MESARHDNPTLWPYCPTRQRRHVVLMVTCALCQLLFLRSCLGQARYPQVQPSDVQLPPGGQLLTTPSMSAPHSPVVEAVMQPRYRLTVRQRHSQLLVTRLPVRRLAVTDSSICNYYQYSPTEVAVVGLGTGTTDLMIWFQGQTSPAIYEVSVVPDDNLEQQHGRRLGVLQAGISQLFPRSQVSLIPIGNQVILKGQAFDAHEAQQILKIVRAEVHRITGPVPRATATGAVVRVSHTSSPQKVTDAAGPSDPVVNLLEVPGEFNVRMRVIIAEVSRTQLRDMGHSLNVTFNSASQGVGASIGGPTQCSLSGIFNRGELSAFVRWLKTNKSVTLLAEPTIVCMSGHSASLLAGGEFAVPTVLGLDGGQTTSFRGVGTSMLVTPTVTERDLIRLKIEPEFSALDGTHVNGVPGTSVKRVHTTVELREGQTLALAGLISRRTQAEVSRPPLLSRIPLIGRALQNKRASEEEVELLVLVTPEIVRGMEPDEVPPLPGDFITQPSDHDLFYYGRTEGPPDSQPRQRWTFGSGQMPGLPLGYSLSDMSAPRHILSAPSQSAFPQSAMPTTRGPLPAAPVLTVPDRHFSPAAAMPSPGRQR
ncbi:MAG: pilus assembly protein N-terminal domain-containing protein [Planctomycetaceae bacterium]|nr:pilus assembly protein N-terminal domain-containing protein [Planctomycetaceae bacterium]